jgi:hypothetical protein
VFGHESEIVIAKEKLPQLSSSNRSSSSACKGGRLHHFFCCKQFVKEAAGRYSKEEYKMKSFLANRLLEESSR